MRDTGLLGVGVVLGWLASKTWSDPGCQLGCGIGSWGGQRPSLGGYVTATGAARG